MRMIGGLLAAAAMAATPLAAVPAPPPVIKHADWVKKPDVDDLMAVWPVEALRQGVGCKVLLQCQVNVHGLPQQCRVNSESRPGLGYGAAALLLTPNFLFRPAVGPDGPVAEEVNIPINFNPDGLALPRPGEPSLERPMTMPLDPTWVSAPSFADVAKAYPARAAGASGRVSLRCDVTRKGGLNDCDMLLEDPPGKGFGAAARSLVPLFRLAVDGKIEGDRRVNLPFRFTDPGSPEFKAHHIALPTWVVLPDPNQMARLYPEVAANRHITTGRGVAECTLDRAGAMTACQPAPGVDDSLGFATSAAQVAPVMRANLWTQEGGPIDGAVVEVPIRFNLAAEPGSAPPAKP